MNDTTPTAVLVIVRGICAIGHVIWFGGRISMITRPNQHGVRRFRSGVDLIWRGEVFDDRRSRIVSFGGAQCQDFVAADNQWEFKTHAPRVIHLTASMKRLMSYFRVRSKG